MNDRVKYRFSTPLILIYAAIQPGYADTPMPDAPEEQPESTPSPTIVGDAVDLEQTTDGGSSAAAWLGRVEKYFQLTAGAVGLVAALGFPAVYLQFSQFHIPDIFVPYDRALRAGILPAVSLTAVSLYLRWAARDFRTRRARPGEVPVSMVPIYRIARAGVLGIYVISWVGMISLAVLIFHRISEVAAGLLGIRLKGRSQLYVATALVLTFSVAMLLPRFMKRRKPISGSQRAVLTAARRFSGPFENLFSGFADKPVRFAVLWTLAAIVMFPGMSMGFLYSIRGALGVLNIGYASSLGNRFIAFVGIVLVLVISMFGSLFIVPALLESTDQKARRCAL